MSDYEPADEPPVEDFLSGHPEFLRQLMDASPVFIVAIGADGRVITMNPALLEALEYTLQEVRGKDYLTNFVPEADREALSELFRRIVESGNATTNENRIVSKSGCEILVEWRGRPVKDPDGKVNFLVGIGIDITERRRMEDALRQSEEKFSRAFLNMHAGASITDCHGRINDVNLEFERQTGYLREEAIGHTVEELNLWADAAEYLTAMRKRTANGRVCDFEFSYRKKTGELGSAIFSSMPITLDGQDCAISMAVDITSLKHAQEDLKRSLASLQESESRFSTLFDLVPFPLGVHEPDGRIRDCNRAFCETAGHSRVELIGRYAVEFLSFRGYEQDDRPGTRVLREAMQRPVELVGVNRQTGRKDIFVLSTADITLDGRPSIVSCAMRITDLRAVQEQLRQSQKMEAMGRVASGIAHDFNNLLTVIGGYTKLALANLPEEGRAYHYIAEANQAVSHAESLTRQLLAFCRNQALHPSLVGLNDLVRETIKLVSRLLGAGIELVLTLAEDLAPVRVDSGQIVQVLINLALNARDAMPEGGRLQIKTAMVGPSDAPQVSLQIGDTGTGMDEETQSHIFEPFFTTKPEGQGTGLGLSTVYGIVEQSGGSISVQSWLGVGSIFEILFPAASTTESPRQERKRASGSTGSKTFLVVEDNEAISEYVELVLTEASYCLLKATNGSDALKIAETHPGDIDVLLTDLTLRGISGRHVAREFRRLRPGVPVIYMSGQANPETLAELIAEPDTVYLQKPFAPETLLDAARESVSGSAHN